MNDPKTSIIKKIQKLLTLANNKGATKAEAENAMSMAQRLMIKHKISMANIDTSEKSNFDIKHESYFKRSATNPADDFIMNILQEFYNIRVIYRAGRGSSEIILIGTPEDIEIAKYIHEYLRNIFFKLWNEYKKTDLRANRKSFYFGVYNGFSAKMRTAQAEEKAKASKKRQDQYDIVLVNTKEAISKYVSNTFKNLYTSRARRGSVDCNSYDAGKARGSNISINKAIYA